MTTGPIGTITSVNNDANGIKVTVVLNSQYPLSNLFTPGEVAANVEESSGEKILQIIDESDILRHAYLYDVNFTSIMNFALVAIDFIEKDA